LPEEIKSKIIFEIDEIENELASYKPLFGILSGIYTSGV
jgi:hypothetical protein